MFILQAMGWQRVTIPRVAPYVRFRNARAITALAITADATAKIGE